MKLGKKKSVFLAFLAALMLAALCFGLIAANGGRAYAEETTANGYGEATYLATAEDGLSFGKSDGKNFIYSAEFTPKNAQARSAGLVFGAGGELTSYWVAAADILKGEVKLWQSESGDLKTAEYQFESGEKFKITVVVNDGIAKVFIDNGDVAVICCKLDDYSGGKSGLEVNGEFDVNKVKFTDTDSPDGDIFSDGYEVLKVVNLTDGNYKLSGNEYSTSGGVLTVSREYLKTLEADTEYVFRVVTSFTDFNFKVTTDFTAVTATPSIEKYYRNNDVTLELSGNVNVHKLLIDGKECEFTQTGDEVVISSAAIGSLSTGKHSVKLYTDKGRPETTITVSEMVETVSEPVVKATHLFLWIDLAIFASAIIGYITFSVISKRKKK